MDINARMTVTYKEYHGTARTSLHNNDKSSDVERERNCYAECDHYTAVAVLSMHDVLGVP